MIIRPPANIVIQATGAGSTWSPPNKAKNPSSIFASVPSPAISPVQLRPCGDRSRFFAYVVIPNDGCGLYLEPAELSEESLILFVLLVSEIQQIQVSGNLAHCWNHISVTITPNHGGKPMRRSGYALSVLRKQPDGSWVITRDANLLAPES